MTKSPSFFHPRFWADIDFSGIALSKSKIMKISVLFIGLLFFSQLAIGMVKKNYPDTIFDLSGSSFEKEYIVDVDPGQDRFGFSLKGKITKGNLKVDVLDPDGNRRCGFGLKTTDENGKQLDAQAKGVGEDFYDDPIPGKWKIRITSSKAKGYLKMSIKN